jgi:hypothetical protein
MIFQFRQKIAYCFSIFLMLISFGMIKPNYSGESTTSNPTLDNKSEISLDIDEIT